MSISKLASTTALVALSVSWLNVAVADSADADCEFHKEGHTVRDASGPCTFSQRQGYVDIKLRNGFAYALKPTDQANHFRDQEGNKVVRSMVDGNGHRYQWEGPRTIIVRFDHGASGYSGNQGYESHPVGATPHDLRDLVHGPFVGGEVEDEMARRGYRHVNDTQSGGEVWSNYRPDRGGQCVVVHLDVKRRVSSIGYGTDSCN